MKNGIMACAVVLFLQIPEVGIAYKLVVDIHN